MIGQRGNQNVVKSEMHGRIVLRTISRTWGPTVYEAHTQSGTLIVSGTVRSKVLKRASDLLRPLGTAAPEVRL
jgi:hypothetical protein